MISPVPKSVSKLTRAASRFLYAPRGGLLLTSEVSNVSLLLSPSRLDFLV